MTNTNDVTPNSVPFSPSRRDFLRQSAAAAGGLVIVHYLEPEIARGAPAKGSSQGPKDGVPFRNLPPKRRQEGLAKVTGAKIFARDFRAQDLPGWPTTERRATILRSPHADRIFEGLDVERLKKEWGALRIVTGDEITPWRLTAAPPFLMPELYALSGKVCDYLGQPLALISWASTADYLKAVPLLAEPGPYLRFGAQGHPKERGPYGSTRFVYCPGPPGEKPFSFVKDGPWAPPWEAPDAKGSPNARAVFFAQKINEDLNSAKDRGWQVFSGSYSTQSIDPMFMEPECGLSWYDPDSRTLSLTLGTQSPQDDGDAILAFMAHHPTVKVGKVVINCCYPGGGFGGRDSSEFPLHLALAAVLEPGVTHRIVLTRFEQFQSGIKRHAAETEVRLALGGRGTFEALHSSVRMDGGGQNNYSFAIQNVGARNAASGYRVTRVLVDSVALPSITVPAGSVRGFGSFQTSFAMECLVDEAATALEVDPITLRLSNVIKGPEEIHTGAQMVVEPGADLVLRAAVESPLWKGRHEAQKKAKAPWVHGVGFALAVKSFGKNPGDACVAGVEWDHDGRFRLLTNAVDMGNGSATTLPLCMAEVLGRPADQIKIGVTTEFLPLGLVGPKAKDEADQERLAQNPYWVPYKAMSTAASATAYQMRHAVMESAQVVLQYGVWPAAAAILGLGPNETKFDPESFKVDAQGLRYLRRGGRLIPWKKLAQKARDQGLATGAMVHAFYRSRWAQASFPMPWGGSYSSAIDALALRRGQDHQFAPVLRTSVDFPPFRTTLIGANRLSSYAAVVAVDVHRETGEVRVVDADCFLDCGPVTLREIVEGQMEGAFAMGVGHTLKEGFPMTDGGPGQGGWNLHRYQVPLAQDCALHKARFSILPAKKGAEPKGMAEVVFNAIPPAIVNAVAHATGRRFRRLPLSPEEIKAALT